MVNDFFLEIVSKQQANLTTLLISGCNSVKSYDLVGRFKNLKALSLGENENVTILHLECITMGCPLIEEFSCIRLANAAFNFNMVPMPPEVGNLIIHLSKCWTKLKMFSFSTCYDSPKIETAEELQRVSDYINQFLVHCPLLVEFHCLQSIDARCLLKTFANQRYPNLYSLCPSIRKLGLLLVERCEDLEDMGINCSVSLLGDTLAGCKIDSVTIRTDDFRSSFYVVLLIC